MILNLIYFTTGYIISNSIDHLGLGLALLIEKAGYNVCGVDISPEYVDKLNNKIYKTKEPEYELLLQNSKNLKATTMRLVFYEQGMFQTKVWTASDNSFWILHCYMLPTHSLEEGLQFSDIIFIVVQTPNSGGDKFYDHSILSNVLCQINSYNVKNKDIIIGCTVMPKYIDEIGNFLLSDCIDTTLNYNPEFIAQGEIIKGFTNPDIILIGTNSLTLGDKLKDIYSKFVLTNPTFCILTPLEAELVKISINGFITTKLSFANMLSDVCDTVGASKEKVLNAVGKDSRISSKYFRPGYSFGGPYVFLETPKH